MLFSAEHGASAIKPTLFLGEDQFSPFGNSIIEKLQQADKEIWYQLIEKAQKATGSKPSAKYLKEAQLLLKKLGNEKFKRVANQWFVFLIELKESQIELWHEWNNQRYSTTETRYLDGLNSEAVKGFIWMSSHFSDQETLENLTLLAERCYKKVPGVGPLAAAVGNACFFTLYKSKGMDGLGKLSRLKQRVKHNTGRKTIEKYLAASAKEKGFTQQEIEDMVVDDLGLIEHKVSQKFGDYQGVISITGIGRSALSWLKPDGSAQKSIPAVVKDAHAAKLKKFKSLQKQINLTLTSQRDRVDWMFRSNRVWKFEAFEKYYLHHGLMSYIAQKLIWIFTDGGEGQNGIWLNEQWVDVNEKPFVPKQTCTVQLWHPALSSVSEIKQWRAFMMAHQIQQPIKQAYREVYILTEAEIRTKSYSNRMAAHILKQNQYVSLTKARNWTSRLLGSWDGGDQDTSVMQVPELNLKAEFWVQSVVDENSISNAGFWLYISTDQVRFLTIDTNQLVDLVDVPPIMFSEVLRDVDLFVGVSSVGNDPTWNDSGNMPSMRDYWQSYSFGDLNEIAKSRKEILSSLLPRLKIAQVSEIRDKFLVVKGKLRTYKIHIGSTNILMEPNDQYLCIVPDGKEKNRTDNLFIPFEGDNGLSIILSKAFLLAADDQITDTTITSQINYK